MYYLTVGEFNNSKQISKFKYDAPLHRSTIMLLLNADY